MVTKRRRGLLSRYFASECTERERRQVEKWVNAAEKNKEIFYDLRRVWELCGAKSEGWSSRRAITALRLKLEQGEISSYGHKGGSLKLYRIIPHRKSAIVHSLGMMAQIAAVFIVLGGTFYAVYTIRKMALEIKTNPQRAPAASFEEVSTKPGQQATLKFWDGTKVILNSDSKLRYRRDDFTGDREFYLDGEAYFEVAHSDSRPLTIRTAQAVIKDIGTKFDVKSWTDDNQTQVTVAEGEVLVHPKSQAQNQNAIVPRGQYSSVKEDGSITPPSYTDIKKSIAWVEGKLVFYNEPMTNVMKQLQRKYGIKCFASDPLILSRTITATLDNRLSPHQVLDLIALSLNVTYRTSNDSVLFVPTKP